LLSDIKQRVNEAVGWPTAMQLHEKVFGRLYVNMVRAVSTPARSTPCFCGWPSSPKARHG